MCQSPINIDGVRAWRYYTLLFIQICCKCHCKYKAIISFDNK